MKPTSRNKQKRTYQILGLIAYLVIVYFGCQFNLAGEGDTLSPEKLIGTFTRIEEHPFSIFPINPENFLLFSVFGILAYLSIYTEYLKRKDLRPSAENGSAKWNENYKRFYKKYAEAIYLPKILEGEKFQVIRNCLIKMDSGISQIPIINIVWKAFKNFFFSGFVRPDTTPRGKNMILSKEIYMSMDTRKTRRNNNVMIFGSSGTGKTRYELKPNILQANCSFVVTDPSGEIIETTGKYLEREGYEVKVFNLAQMNHSNCYNPFNYIRDDLGVITMITALIKNTTEKGSKSSDPFWEKAETALLQALCFFLISECNPEDRNFSNVMKLLRCAEVREGQEDYDSTLDILFKDLAEKDPEHIAVRQYAVFKQAAGKTAQSILVSCSVRLTVFNMKEIHKLTGTDDIHLETLGDKKTALFCITPTADTSFNFLVSLLYTQLFETLYHKAETECKGKRLPVHVRFLLDEFANIACIPDFEQKLATMRKFEISCTIIYQALSQTKTQYKDEWETIIGNCDSFVFLGGADITTFEYVSKRLGKETIRAIGDSRSYGKQGSHSISHSKVGRELMTLDELGIMDNDNCILFVRGERPFFCTKYPLEEHPMYKYIDDKIDDNYFDVKELINTGERRKAKKPVRKPRNTLKDLERADSRDSERQMHKNSRKNPYKSIKGQDLGVIKPLEEGVEESIRVSQKAEMLRQQEEEYRRYAMETENDLVSLEDFNKSFEEQENPDVSQAWPVDEIEIQDMNETVFDSIMEPEEVKPIPSSAEVMFDMYGGEGFEFGEDIESEFNINF